MIFNFISSFANETGAQAYETGKGRGGGWGWARGAAAPQLQLWAKVFRRKHSKR